MITLSLCIGLILFLVFWFGGYPAGQTLMAVTLFTSLVIVAELGFAALRKRMPPLWDPDLPRIGRALKRFAIACMVLFAIKLVWVPCCGISGEKLLASQEKTALMQRRQWLLENVATPRFSLSQMPVLLETAFKQEWAIGSLSMTTGALTHLAFEYPETREESLNAVGTMISRILQDDIAGFENTWWGEDALTTLDGNKGHAGYLGHLNFMLGAWRFLGGDGRFNVLHQKISATLARRVIQSRHHYIETFPGQIFIPDVAVVVASLAMAHDVIPGFSDEAVRLWLDYTKSHLIDPKTGIMRPWISATGQPFGPPRGSYAAWTIYYLTWIDPEFARNQYKLVKENFAEDLPFGAAALREYKRGYSGPADVDSGPIVLGLSTSGTGFIVAGARLNGDAAFLDGLLRTAEAVGSTVILAGKRHYLLAPTVGEAIMLAMMTTQRWDTRYLLRERT